MPQTGHPTMVSWLHFHFFNYGCPDNCASVNFPNFIPARSNWRVHEDWPSTWRYIQQGTSWLLHFILKMQSMFQDFNQKAAWYQRCHSAYCHQAKGCSTNEWFMGLSSASCKIAKVIYQPNLLKEIAASITRTDLGSSGAKHFTQKQKIKQRQTLKKLKLIFDERLAELSVGLEMGR